MNISLNLGLSYRVDDINIEIYQNSIMVDTIIYNHTCIYIYTSCIYIDLKYDLLLLLSKNSILTLKLTNKINLNITKSNKCARLVGFSLKNIVDFTFLDEEFQRETP